jgi:hypothetical protein
MHVNNLIIPVAVLTWCRAEYDLPGGSTVPPVHADFWNSCSKAWSRSSSLFWLDWKQQELCWWATGSYNMYKCVDIQYFHRWALTSILMSAISDIRHRHLLFRYRRQICRTENCHSDTGRVPI